MKERIAKEMNEAEEKALDALGRSKFQMFGYWAAIWVHLNCIGEFNRPNPFKQQVLQAREDSRSGTRKSDNARFLDSIEA